MVRMVNLLEELDDNVLVLLRWQAAAALDGIYTKCAEESPLTEALRDIHRDTSAELVRRNHVLS